MSFIAWAELLNGVERSTRAIKVLRCLEALARQVQVIYTASPKFALQYATQFTGG